ncbi:MAG TPA: DNA polymerase III subunit delta [Candidatus Monoglobus merdigallinarum]|uniref:DNA polymerase III subunit delta n=1 Tax=Candidatus Monoglobus merdigallinarum TaxID=2838698 RepID=A0A9D1PR41_9FIRM|nr:DNA polymerase III subunit delta [Candidatus Monoglobus merdigallinarum]
MTVEELNTVLKNGAIPNVLFFFGEEEYLLENKIKAVIKRLIPGDLIQLNYSVLDENVTADEIEAVCGMLPQLCGRRVVLVKNSGIFENLNNSDFKKIKEYIMQLPEYICLVFWEQRFESKKAKSLKFIDDIGGVVEFKFMPVNKLELWIEKKLENAGKRIIARDLSYFVRESGQSMAKLETECEKLIMYMGDTRRKVTREDIDAVVDRAIEARVYDVFSKYILGGRGGKAMEQLARLKAENASAAAVMSIILDQVYELLLCKLLKSDGLSVNEMLKYFDRQPPVFAVKKNIESSARFNEAYLKRMVDKGLKYTIDMKSGKIDMWDAVELYVSELVHSI